MRQHTHTLPSQTQLEKKRNIAIQWNTLLLIGFLKPLKEKETDDTYLRKPNSATEAATTSHSVQGATPQSYN